MMRDQRIDPPPPFPKNDHSSQKVYQEYKNFNDHLFRLIISFVILSLIIVFSTFCFVEGGKAGHHQALRVKYSFKKYDLINVGLMHYQDKYLLYSIHTNREADMQIEINGEYIDVGDLEISEIISLFYGIEVSDDEIVLLAVCYPQRIKDLRTFEDNVIVLGDWNTPTDIYDFGDTLPVYTK
jgi:hypothetical protein